MAGLRVVKRKGRKHYFVRIDGKYRSTGQTEQRAALEAGKRMHAIGVEAFRQGQQLLGEELVDLIKAHLDYLRDNDGRGHEHIRKKRLHLMRPINERVFRCLRDVRKKPIQRWLSSLDCGAKTRNEYQTSWNVFLDWLVFEDLLEENPIKGKIRRARTSKDVTRTRRALTIKELSSLVSVSERRGLLYLTAATTGGRFNELRQLRWADVYEWDEPPRIVLRAETTKNRKERTQYITSELSSALSAARQLAKTERVFQRMPSHHTVNKDLATAGILKQTNAGIACFHSLRHTFTTIIARLTKDPRLAQRMADHADIKTTQNYLHTEQDEHATTMHRFPSLRGGQRATGRATEVVQLGQIESNCGVFGLSESYLQPFAADLPSPILSGSVTWSPIMEPGGIEPPSRGSQHGASTRVVAVDLSRRRSGLRQPFLCPASESVSPPRAEAPVGGQPDVSDRHPIGRQAAVVAVN